MDLVFVVVLLAAIALVANWFRGDETVQPQDSSSPAAQEDTDLPEQSRPERFAQLLPAAESGDPGAMLAVAELLETGGGGAPQDDARAFEWVRRAAGAANPDAHFPLAAMLRHGRGTPPDPERALEIFLRLAGEGHIEAMIAAGTMLCRGEGTAPDPETGKRWLAQAEERGGPRDLTSLADLWLAGDGIPADHARAMRLYRQAADQRAAYFDIYGLPQLWKADPMAMIALGRMHALGQGTRHGPDPVRATDWYSRALGTGDSEAIATLAKMHREGDCVPRDEAKAAELDALLAERSRSVLR
jgi:hypothetical protein